MSVFDPDVPVLPTPRLYSSRRPGRYRTRMTRAEFLALRAAGKELPGLGNIELIDDPGSSDWHPPRLGDVPGGPGSGLLDPELPAPDPQVRPEPYDPRGEQDPGNPTASSPPRLAINLVSFFLQPVFSTVTAMVNDTTALDAAVVRQPGLVNLFLSHIYDISGEGASLRIPRITRSEFDVPLLLSRITSSSSWAYLRRVVRQLALHGGRQKVLITFIDFGGGKASAWRPGAVYTPDDGGETFALSNDAPSYLGQEDPIFVPWGADLAGQEVRDILTGETLPFYVGDEDDEEWRYYTLDPHNGVKRRYFALLSRALGRALVAMADTLEEEDGIDLSSLIEGIEIGNELEVRHTLEGDVDPEGWATFYYHCATALRAECDWVPLYLPAISSYAPQTEAKLCMTWDAKRRFLREMLTTLESLCIVGRARGLDYALTDLVDGIDYHFYHHAASTDAQADTALPLHFLASEVAVLKTDLAKHLPSALLSVCESGVNVLCSDDEEDAGSVCEARAAPGAANLVSWRPAGVTDPLAFQASSVIMRLSIALASGAGMAGWHSHAAVSMSDGFRAMGLHFDQLNLTDADVSTSDLSFRPAWWSFQRLAQVMKAATGVTRLAPETVSDREGLKSGEIESKRMVWVIEIPSATWPDEGGVTADTSGLWTAYLLFIEPGGPDRPPPTSATVRLIRGSRLGPVFPALSWVYQLPSVPSAIDSVVGRLDRFPLARWTTERVITHRARSSGLKSPPSSYWSFTVRPQDAPILLFSTFRLAVDASGIAVEE